MNQKLPSSAALHATLARIDAAIFAARDNHFAAETAARNVVIDDIEYVSTNADNLTYDVGSIIVPSTDDTASRLNHLHQAREVAVEMLARAQEAERLARVETAHAQLRAVVQLMKTEAQKIDAAYPELAKSVVGLDTLRREADAIMRLQLGINPLPQTLASDVAKSIGAYIAASTGAFPPDHKPVASMHADKFASRSLTDAGAL